LNSKKTQTNAFANLIGSIVFLVIGTGCWIKAASFKEVRNTYVQPAAFPRIMIAGMLIFAAALLIQSIHALLTMDKAAPDSALMEGPLVKKAPSFDFLHDKGLQGALLVMVLCVAYTMLFKPLGYVAASFLLSIAIMFLIGKRKPVQMILISVLVPLAMFIIFYKVLKVNIPMGPLKFLRDLLDML
jgi:putative tricarboxylic transport membrane protein